jgi:hypothetical protein
MNNNKKIVIPRTIVKTVEIQKINIELPYGLTITNSINDNIKISSVEEKVSADVLKRRKYYKTFWEEFIVKLELDDPGQPMPVPTITQNIYLYPGNNKYSWISAYFQQSQNRVGVYYRCQNDQNGQSIVEFLMQSKEEIERELGKEVIWKWESNPIEGFGVRLPLDDVHSEINREKIKIFFALWINKFVNAIRPRLKEI